MSRIEVRRRFLPALLAFAAMLTACGDDNPLGPLSQLEVSNAPDFFLLQVRFMEDGTDFLTYDWTNTGTQATVDISQVITGGRATFVVKDHAGTEVYQDDIANDNDGETLVGVAGDWTIEIQIQDATGTFDLAIRKKI